MTFNVIISKGFFPPTVRQPITKIVIRNLSFQQHQKNNMVRSRWLTHHIIWAKVCFYTLQGKFEFGFTCSLDSESFRNSTWIIWVMFFFFVFFFILEINIFLVLKILLGQKVLQVFPGKIIAWKRISTVVNKFTCNRKSKIYRGKFTTGKTFSHGVFYRT